MVPEEPVRVGGRLLLGRKSPRHATSAFYLHMFFFLLYQNVEALYQSIGEVFSESVVIFFGPFTLSRQTTRKKSYNAYFGRK